MRLLAPLVPLLVAACGGPPSVAGPDLHDRLVLEVRGLAWNPEGPFPQEAGVAVLQHLGGAPAVHVSPLEPRAPALCPPTRLEPGSSAALPLTVLRPEPGSLSLFAEYELGGPVHGTAVFHHDVRNACGDDREWVARVRRVVECGRLPRTFYSGYKSCAVGVTVAHAVPFAGERVPDVPWTEIVACGSFRAPVDETVWKGGVRAEVFDAPGTDDRMLLWMRLQGEVPARLDQHLQYAFALETNGDPGDDYVPAPDFARDAFAGTDRWYELRYRPAAGWRLRVTGARGCGFGAASSGARALLLGDVVAVAVPAAELHSATGFRASAFAHGGDFGLQPPHVWSGDREPRLSAGLHPPTR